jgi:hypothetical protein
VWVRHLVAAVAVAASALAFNSNQGSIEVEGTPYHEGVVAAADGPSEVPLTVLRGEAERSRANWGERLVTTPIGKVLGVVAATAAGLRLLGVRRRREQHNRAAMLIRSQTVVMRAPPAL